MTACIFALLGFSISCACYSVYLSGRDYESFRSLFDLLGLINYIQYGTFNKICENILNKNGDLRKTVGDLITSNTFQTNSNNASLRSKILLIDEVDVFFNQEFYGNIYTPSVSLKDPTIKVLIDYIWKEKSSITFEKLKTTYEYKNCCNRFQNWTSLIEEAAKSMVSGVKSFKSHQYIVKDGKIG